MSETTTPSVFGQPRNASNSLSDFFPLAAALWDRLGRTTRHVRTRPVFEHVRIPSPEGVQCTFRVGGNNGGTGTEATPRRPVERSQTSTSASGCPCLILPVATTKRPSGDMETWHAPAPSALSLWRSCKVATSHTSIAVT